MLERVWRKGNTLTLLVGMYVDILIQPVWKIAWRFLEKLGIKPPYDPAIPLLGIYPKETKIEKHTHTPEFTAALFTIARICQQVRCSSKDKWIKKLWYIHTMEYYSSIKRNTFELVTMRWTNLEPIIQSEISQKEKNKQCILMHIYGIQKDGTDDSICRAAVEMQTQNRLVYTGQVREREEWREQHGNIYTTNVKQTASGNVLCDSVNSTRGSVIT